MATTEPVSFTAVGEATINGQTYVSEPIPFNVSGLSLKAEVGTSPTTGEPVFAVLRGPARNLGVARFEKTCMEPVLFNVYRNGEPFQQVVIQPFKVMSLSLVDQL